MGDLLKEALNRGLKERSRFYNSIYQIQNLRRYFAEERQKLSPELLPHIDRFLADAHIELAALSLFPDEALEGKKRRKYARLGYFAPKALARCAMLLREAQEYHRHADCYGGRTFGEVIANS